MAEQLEFTGERFTPECVREIRYEHIHRYAVAAELTRGKRVLDAACGEGYGACLLARTAGSVTGVDISAAAIGHATERYRAGNLAFQVADCCALPFEDGCFDAVVSFETLEHLEAQDRLIREFRRVLAADGFLVISSPDKAVYTDRLENRNPFHVRELYREELERLLAQHFPAVRLLGQRLAFHSMIWSLAGADVPPADRPPAAVPAVLHQEDRDAIRRLPGPSVDAVYFIALCAAQAQHLPELDAGLWLFDDAAESVYRHYHHEIRKNMQAGRILEQREWEIEALKAAGDLAPVREAEPPGRPWWRRWLHGS